MVLLRLSRERNNAPTEDEALNPDPEKPVNMLDETKQRSSLDAGGNDEIDRTHLVVPLLLMTGGLSAWQ
ncbi:hypothetical protein TNCV_2469581 [Trichonephila clavipes]|nr:hypothetical protein TNCV_2469581 [Trichonephila clavipes]